MAMMATNPVFLDTNILVYATISAAPLHTVALQAVVDREQVHDNNSLATMQVNTIHRLLTHNVADFSRCGGLITILPLVPTP